MATLTTPTAMRRGSRERNIAIGNAVAVPLAMMNSTRVGDRVTSCVGCLGIPLPPAQHTAVKQRPHQETTSSAQAMTEPVLPARASGRTVQVTMRRGRQLQQLVGRRSSKWFFGATRLADVSRLIVHPVRLLVSGGFQNVHSELSLASCGATGDLEDVAVVVLAHDEP